MANPKTTVYTYVDAITNKPVSPFTFNVNNIDNVLRTSLYTLRVSKIIKHGSFLWDGVEFNNVIYFLERETV
jgi:hypothetical protein